MITDENHPHPAAARDSGSAPASEGSTEAFAAALRRGDWAFAHDELRAAKERGMDAPGWALRECDWYVAQQRYDEAAHRLKALLALPSSPDEFALAVRHNLASIAFLQQDFRGSVGWLSPMLDPERGARPLPPGFLATQVLWVRSLYRARALTRLYAWVAQLDSLGQLDAGVAGLASLGVWEKGEDAVARRWSSMSREAIGASHRPVEGWLARTFLALADRKLDEADAVAEQAVTHWPADGRAWAARGLARLARGDGQGAERAFERATPAAADFKPGWLGQGWAKAMTGRLDEARRSFEAAVALDDRHAQAHGGLAVVLAMQGQREAAEERLSLCRTLLPETDSARHAEAILAGEAGHRFDIATLCVALTRDPREEMPRAAAPAPASRVDGGTQSRAGSIQTTGAGEKDDENCRIAIVTPTWGRPHLLAQTLRYFLAQDVPRPENLHWFVLDDSPEPDSLSTIGDPRIHYVHLPQKVTLGSKRNQLNEMARQWGADFICSMDDDDWYGPSYVSSMVALLRDSGQLFAGSSKDYYYHLPTGTVMRVGASGPGHSCNAVLCYRASALQGRHYDDGQRFAEEASFLNGAFVAQHPDIGQVHIALAHGGNTVSKEGIFRAPACHTDLELSAFPMRPEDQAFYKRLTEFAAIQVGASQVRRPHAWSPGAAS